MRVHVELRLHIRLLSAEVSKSTVASLVSGSLDKEDYYKVLGVPRNASQKEIKKAYYEVELLFIVNVAVVCT